MPIFRSPLPSVEVPDVTLPDLVLSGADRLGDRPAVIDYATGRTLTYEGLLDAVPRAAAGLAQRGLGKGDVVAICVPNCPEFPILYFGAAKLGAITTTMNPLYTAEELAKQLDDSGAKLLVTVPGCLEKAEEALERTDLREIFVLGGDGGESDGPISPFETLLDNDGRFEPPQIDPAEDVVALPYSSGTTGKPKGVMLTHRNLVSVISQTAGIDDVGDHPVYIGVIPFFHIYGMTVILAAGLNRGGTIVSLPRYRIEDFLGAIEDHRATVAYVVPPILLTLAKDPVVDGYDLSSLKFISSGGAPLGKDLAAACANRLGCVVKQGYGMTETSGVSHTNPYGGRIKVPTVGFTIPDTECKVLDIETGAELGPGETGELWIRGPQVMKGYWNRPDATAECLTEDGWLRTGDIVVADEDGYFRVVDRLKEFIKYKGYQVAPAELEDVLTAHPRIADAAVVPSPDEEAGEVPKAFVVVDGEIGDDEIFDHVAERVAPYKKIRRLERTDEIPRSASGKILRRVLIEREREAVAASPGEVRG